MFSEDCNGVYEIHDHRESSLPQRTIVDRRPWIEPNHGTPYPMKKILIGLLIVFMLLGIGGAVAGYYFLYRPAKAYVASFSKLQEIPKLDAQVSNKSYFKAPTSGELTTEGVQRFVQTQQALTQRLGTRLDELDRKYKTLNQVGEGGPSVKEALNALRDLAGLVLEAKRFQIEALNQHNFSIEEYDWTRARVYEASGIPFDLTFQRAIRDAAAGKVPDFEPNANSTDAEVPEKNRTLVAPHQKQLTDAVGLAFFGL